MGRILPNRSQSIYLSGICSAPQTLSCGVPQGLVLGRILFTLYTYTSPLGQLLRSHEVNYCLYADDTQIYLLYDENGKSLHLKQLESCIADVRSWMKSNMLKLNEEKSF